jgi:hypothetical protein
MFLNINGHALTYLIVLHLQNLFGCDVGLDLLVEDACHVPFLLAASFQPFLLQGLGLLVLTLLVVVTRLLYRLLLGGCKRPLLCDIVLNFIIACP